MSSDVLAFSEKLFDTFLHNNCRAMYIGFWSFQSVEDVKRITVDNEPSIMKKI
jgi:hypothetical protein